MMADWLNYAKQLLDNEVKHRSAPEGLEVAPLPAHSEAWRYISIDICSMVTVLIALTMFYMFYEIGPC